MKLMYITNSPQLAEIASKSGVDWIFIDLELLGKEKRQGHLDTVISRHKISDIKPTKEAAKESKILVRINPINPNTEQEILEVIGEGADIIMLPYFSEVKEVKIFLDLVKDKAEKCLLVETMESVKQIDKILELEGIDYIHIGMNDLHLEMKQTFMFENLANGLIQEISKKIDNRKILFGFGGIARLGQGDLPSELILDQHFILNSELVILSRSFFTGHVTTKNYNEVSNIFSDEVKKIRDHLDDLKAKDKMYFIDSLNLLKDKVKKIVMNRLGNTNE